MNHAQFTGKGFVGLAGLALLASPAVAQTFIEDVVIAELNPDVFNTIINPDGVFPDFTPIVNGNGFLFESFGSGNVPGDDGMPLVEGDASVGGSSFVINTDSFGGLGASFTTPTAFPAANAGLELDFVIGASNTATTFIVTLVDGDGEGIAEEFQFFADLSAGPGATVTAQAIGPLSDDSLFFNQPAFGSPPSPDPGVPDFGSGFNNGLNQIQIASQFELNDPGNDEVLDVSISSVRVVGDLNVPTPIAFGDGTDNPDGFVFNVATFRQFETEVGDGVDPFTFFSFNDSFGDAGGVPQVGDTEDPNAFFALNTPTQGGGSELLETPGNSGGFGLIAPDSTSANPLFAEFDPATHALQVEARLTPENTADFFNVILGDVDRDTTLVPVESTADVNPEGNLGDEDFLFQFNTSDFDSEVFQTVTIDLDEGSQTALFTQFFSEDNAGDGLLADPENGLFQLNQVILASSTLEDEFLGLELASIAIVPREEEPLIGDFSGDGFVGFDDINLVLLNFGDETLDDLLPEGAEFFVENLSANPLAGTPAGVFDGLIGQNELDDVLLNFGEGSPGTVAVPEPASLLLLGAGGLALAGRRRK